MHVDLDAFYAACELARRPELQGLPVIVGGERRGVVLAATYEARAYGVRSAMTGQNALRLCPTAIVIQPDFRYYSYVSESVMSMMREITPVVEQVSIDEAFLDVSGSRRRLGPPTVIGAALRKKVAATHGVTCSVGIAKNKFLAKLASTQAKPDGLLLVPAPATDAFLRTLPAGALWGVGEKTEAQLRKWGITQVAQLADLDLATLQMMLGKASGYHLNELAHGRDPRPVTPRTSEKSLGAESTFGTDQHDIEQVSKRLLELCDQVAGRLRKHSYLAGTIAVKVRTSDFNTVSRSRALPSPTDLALGIYAVAKELLLSVDLNGLPVRLVGVRAEKLRPKATTAQQETLMEATSRADFRQAELTLDQIRSRFGRKAVRIGTP
jgi:DNA polymerase-4